MSALVNVFLFDFFSQLSNFIVLRSYSISETHHQTVVYVFVRHLEIKRAQQHVMLQKVHITEKRFTLVSNTEYLDVH